VPKEKPTRTTLYLDPELWKQMRIEAVKRGESATTLVNGAIKDWLKAQKGGR
jgi:hypothetical protein